LYASKHKSIDLHRRHALLQHCAETTKCAVFHAL